MKSVLAFPLAIIEMALAMLEAVTSTIRGHLAIVGVYLYRDYDYKRWLHRDLADCETILELGCGSFSPILKIGYGNKTTAIDIFEPYIAKHKRLGSYKESIKGNILTMVYPTKAFDAVVMCDVLEHLPRDCVMAIDLFGQMEQCARKKVIIFAPNGFVPNDLVDGDPYQAHMSAWEPEDYRQRGYRVKGATGLRYLFGKASLPKYHPYLVCAIIGMLSMPLVYHKPEWAWHSYAVKDM